MFKKINLLVVFAILLMFASSFTEEDSSNTVTDIDGNVYQTLKIGTQTWMVENLKTTKYNDGTSIPYVSDSTAWPKLSTPGYCFYNNDAANKNTYGALYNWYTINTGKLAPTGWHVPTDAEWTTLENYLIANGYNYDGTTTGNKIAKSLAATILWNTDTTDWAPSTNIGDIGNDLTKNNNSGFAGLPGGARLSEGRNLSPGRFSNSRFLTIGYNGIWWSSTLNYPYESWNRRLSCHSSDVDRFSNRMQSGFSVRCLRDN